MSCELWLPALLVGCFRANGHAGHWLKLRKGMGVGHHLAVQAKRGETWRWSQHWADWVIMVIQPWELLIIPSGYVKIAIENGH